jgi:hypothetical protein
LLNHANYENSTFPYETGLIARKRDNGNKKEKINDV